MDDEPQRQSNAKLGTNESLLRQLIKYTPAAVAMFDSELRYLEASDRWLTDYHLSGDVIGRSHYEVFPDLPERWKAVHQRVLQGAVERCDEDPFPRADGSLDWLQWEVRPWHSVGGEIAGLIMFTQVITERKRAELERIRLTQDLGERVKELTLLHGALRLLQQDRPFDQSLLTELVAMIPAAWQFPDLCEARIRYGGLVVSTSGFEPTVELEPTAQRQSATFGEPVELSGQLEVTYRSDAAGRRAFLAEEQDLLQSVADLLSTHLERRQALEALRRAEEKFSSIFLAAPVGIAITRADDGQLVDVNREFEKLLGYSRREAIGHSTMDLGLWLNTEMRQTFVNAVEEHGGVDGFEVPIRTKAGVFLPLSISAQQMRLDDQLYLLSAFVDLTERKRAEALVRASEARLRRVIASPILGVAFCNADGVITEANDEFRRIAGYASEELGQLHLDTLISSRRGSLLPSGDGMDTPLPSKSWEVEFAAKDGRQVPALIGVSAIDDERTQQVAFVFDLTERRALERQLQQTQRMEAVGRLAAGVAHDFNNVLAAIAMGSDLLQEELKANSLGVEEVREIRRAADRGVALTRQLLAFTRQQVLEPKVLDLNQLVSNLEKMLRRLIGVDIAFVTRFETPLGAVRADQGQLEQVIMNLALNARDAMSDGGVLTIETNNVEFAVEQYIGHIGLPPGKYVLLSVTDTGTGIDAPTKVRMFEPFFTTKDAGKGTGLGLSMAYGIVRQSGGAIDVISEPQQGATLRIFLPRAAEAVREVLPSGAPEAVGGTETILVVEDDVVVRQLCRRVLARLGYRVIEAASTTEAAAVANVYVGSIDLLLTDLVMPGGSGRSLATALLAERPKMRVLYMSGYTDDAVVRQGVLGAGVGYIPKPFSAAALARKLRSLLDSDLVV